MEKGLYIKTDGTIEWKEFEIGNSYQLLRDSVDGYIERVSLKGDIDLWLNEEGKLIGLEPNKNATLLFWGTWGIGSDIIVGDVFLANSNSEGDTVGLTDEQIDHLLDVLPSFA